MGLPYDPNIAPDSTRAAQRKQRRRFSLVERAALVTLVALVALALTGARGGFGHWRHGHGDPEEIRAHAAFAVERMLGRIDASEEQTEEIQVIVDATLVDLFAFRAEHEDFHVEATAALTSEKVDREGLESMRREKLASFDAASQRMVAAIADISEVLTPAQRAAIAARLEERHGRRSGWHH